jgi:hypothetical protein
VEIAPALFKTPSEQPRNSGKTIRISSQDDIHVAIDRRHAMAKIFISYRREDTESFANHLKSELEKYVGKGKVFLDSKDIPPGRDWSDVLQRSVLGSDYLLALIGPKWLNIEDSQTKKRRLDHPDDVVRQEIRGALKNKKMVVVPVLVGDARMPEQKDLPDELKELAFRQNFELRQRRWEDDVRALAQELKLIPRSILAKSKTGMKVAASLVPAALIYGLVVVPDAQEINDLNAKVIADAQEINELHATVYADAQETNELHATVFADAQEIDHLNAKVNADAQEWAAVIRSPLSVGRGVPVSALGTRSRFRQGPQ